MTKPGMITERMNLSHLAVAAELERICFAEPWSEQALKLLVGDMAVGFAVRNAEGRMIAYGGMLIAPDEGQITNIAVHPGFRRLGAGRAVLLALEQEAVQRDLEQICLEVRESNLAARSLYERSGFETVGRRKHFYRNPTEDAFVMLRKLRKLR